jgi:hypothetical protein
VLLIVTHTSSAYGGSKCQHTTRSSSSHSFIDQSGALWVQFATRRHMPPPRNTFILRSVHPAPVQ